MAEALEAPVAIEGPGFTEPIYLGPMHGFMYILLCSNGSYYVGSTRDLERRIAQHQRGEGANHTRKYGPVELVYFEWFPRVDHAFYREKQVQGWSRKKKQALIEGQPGMLPELAKAYRDLKDLNPGG